MSDRSNLEIRITGSNGTTQVFRAVASDAQRMGDAVEQAGRRGSRSMDEWSRNARNLGSALGATTAVALKFAGDAEAAEARLSTAFQNAGLAVEDYADSVKRIADEGLDLGFDDEDTTDAIAQLITVTGSYETAIADLAIAQDLARARQIDLAAATNIVANTEAGRFRSLQMMGIALDETATKEEYLAALQERVAGSSEAFATTGAADFARWQNTAENALESVGAHLTAVQGPMLALSAGTTLFGAVGGALKDMGAGAKLASLAMGPAGLVAAAGLAVGGLVLLGRSLQDTTLDADDAAKGIEDFNALIAELGASGASVDLTTQMAAFVRDLNYIAIGSESATGQLGQLRDQLDALNAQLEQNRAAPDYLQEDTAAIEEQVAALERQIAALEAVEITTDQFAAAQSALADITQRTGQINYPILIARLEELSAELRNGTITADEYVWNLRWLQENAATYGVTLEELAAQQRGATSAAEQHFTALGKLAEATGQQIGLANDAGNATTKLGEQIGETEAQTTRYTIAQIEARRADEERIGALTHGNEAMAQTESFLLAVQEAMRGGTQAAILNTDAIREYAEALDQMPAGETFGERLAQRAGAAGTALGDAFRTGVGNVGDLGGQSAQVAKWALELSNVEDGYSELNQLLDEGRLTADEYNAAVAAGNVIQSENAEIQRHVLDIQASQLPILADLTAEQERYLEHIARQPAELQAVALAYMDNETSAKALEAAQLAAAAAAGELGVAGTATAQKMIEGAAQADPYLKALLVDMGLISIGADGTITVNFDSVEDAGASLADVVTSLETLSGLLIKTFAILIDSESAVSAKGNIDLAAEALRLLDENGTADVDITADTSAFYNEVEGINGATLGTAYINIEGRQIGISGSLTGLHGGVLGYAHGGIVARMAEAGPELLRFRDGGMGLALTDGLYGVPRGTYVTPAPETKRQLAAGGPSINFYGPVTIAANDPREFYDAAYEMAMGSART